MDPASLPGPQGGPALRSWRPHHRGHLPVEPPRRDVFGRRHGHRLGYRYGISVRRIFLDDAALSMRRTEEAPVLEVSCGNVRRGTSRMRGGHRSGEAAPVEGEGESAVTESAPDPALAELLGLPADASFTARSGERILVGYGSGRVELWGVGAVRPFRQLVLESQILPTSGVAASGDRVASWIAWRETGNGSNGLRFWTPSTLEVVSAEAGLSTTLASGLFLDEGSYFCEFRDPPRRGYLGSRPARDRDRTDRGEGRKPQRTSFGAQRGAGSNQFVEVQYGLTGPGVAIWEYAEGALRRSGSSPPSRRTRRSSIREETVSIRRPSSSKRKVSSTSTRPRPVNRRVFSEKEFRECSEPRWGCASRKTIGRS